MECHTPLIDKNPHYLVLEVTKPGEGGGVRNLGFNRGITVREGEKYDFSCWARGADTAGLALRVRLESDSGEALSDTLLSAWEPDGQGKAFIITGDPAAENSFEEPEKISPAESAVQIEGGLLSAALPGHSLTIFIIPIKE